MKLFRPLIDDIESNLIPDASGTRDLGTVSLSWDDAYIDKVYLEDDPTTPLQAATKQYVDSIIPLASGTNEALVEGLKEPTGFEERTTSHISFDDTSMTFTIIPSGVSSYDMWSQGTKVTKNSSQSVAIPDTQGSHFIYYTAAGVLSSTTSFNPQIITGPWIYVGSLYWSVADSSAIFVGEERHGSVMDGQTHSYLHTTRGTQFVSGLALGDFDIDGTGDDATNAQLSVADGSIRDEDIILTITDGYFQTLALPAKLPVYYKDGANGYWKKDTARVYPMKNFSGGTGRLAWNEWTGATWQQTEIDNNSFVLSHMFATNDIYNPIICVQGQTQYGAITSARDGASTEINNLVTTGMAFQEFKAIGSIILQTSNGYANEPKARIRTTDLGSNYVDFRFTGVTSVSTVSDHGSLTGLTDDDHIQYLRVDGTRATTGTFTPNASGTIDIGTVSLAFDDAYIDKVYLEADPTTPLMAATKQYVDAITESDTLQTVTDRGATTSNTIINTNTSTGSHMLISGNNGTSYGIEYNSTGGGSTHKDINIVVNGYDLIQCEYDTTVSPFYIVYVNDRLVVRNDDLIVQGGNISTTTGNVTMGTVSNDTGTFTMIKGAQTGDPQVQFALSSDANGDFSITADTGDITLSPAGNVISTASIIPNASGTIDLGSISNAFDDAHINKVYLEGSPTTSLQATTKDYVDSLVQGLDWQPSVDGRRGAPPVGPSTGDRYIATATASGWTDNNIYEYQAGWQETVANEGFSSWVEDEDVQYVFNGIDWVKFGSTATHNNLAGIQGGTTDEYYHLTSTEYTGDWGSKNLQTTGDVMATQLYNAADTDTWLDFTVGNTVSLYTNNVQRFVIGTTEFVFNETGADVDFRVESDNSTHALFVQGSDGFVGINTANPLKTFDIETALAADFAMSLRGDLDGAGQWTGIRFGYNSASNDVYQKGGLIFYGVDNNARLDFIVALDSATDSGNVTLTDEKFRISNAGVLTSTQNSDTFTLTGDGSDWYQKWSDGYLKLQTDEGTNTASVVQIIGKGSGQILADARIALIAGNDSNYEFNYTLDGSLAYTSYGTSVTKHKFNQFSSDVDHVVGTAGSSNSLFVEGSSALVGLNTATPSGHLHIFDGATSAPLYAAYDNFVIEDDTTMGMTLLTTDTDTANINFGTPSSQFAAGIRAAYNGGNEYIDFRIADATKFRVNGTESTTYGDFYASASGSWDIGSAAYSFSQGHIDDLYTDTIRGPVTIQSPALGQPAFRVAGAGSTRQGMTLDQFGYSSAYKVLMLGSTSTDYTTHAVTISMGCDFSDNPWSGFNGGGNEIIFRNSCFFLQPDTTNTSGYYTFRMSDGKVGLRYGSYVNDISDDITLGDDSSLALVTEHAVKTYVDGVVSTPNLQAVTTAGNTTTNNILVNADTDTVGGVTVGRAKMGFPTGGYSDYAFWGHVDRFGDTTSYALAQGPTGDTTINGSAATAIYFNLDGTSYGVLNTSSFGWKSDTDTVGGVIASRAKMGTPTAGGGDFAYFGHVDHFGDGNSYALAQGPAGQTYLSGASNQDVRVYARGTGNASLESSSSTYTLVQADTGELVHNGTTVQFVQNTYSYWIDNSSSYWYHQWNNGDVMFQPTTASAVANVYIKGNTTSSAGAYLYLEKGGSTSTAWSIGRDTGSNVFRQRYNGTTLLTMQTDGKMCLGTTSVANKDGLTLYSSATPYVEFYNGSTGVTASDGAAIALDGNLDFWLINRETGDINTYVGGATLISAQSTGKVAVGGSHTATSTLDVAGDIEVGSANYIYMGDPTTDGSWRFGIDSGNMVVQKRESSSWVTKGTFSS